LVENRRYSVAGLPCLYLGSSLWICWEELGRPELDTVLVSRFALAKQTTILDFQYTPKIFWDVYAYLAKETKAHHPADGYSNVIFESFNKRLTEETVAAYLRCWPLIAACSIKVESRKGPFFPQYIVPQMLLQWVSQSRKVDGIRYFSTRVPSLDASPHAQSNCVFPSRNIIQTGICSHLNGMFTLISPIAWEILQAIDIGHVFDFGPSNATSGMRLSDDIFVMYKTTGFYEAEIKLAHFEADSKYSRPASYAAP
jgi:hypothetical protein